MPMDYANERFVLLYTRDTATWKLLDWEARAVLMFLLRKVDRSGVIDVGEDGVDGLAAVLEVPVEVVARALPKLIARKTVTASDTSFAMPNFLEAQETPRSDKQRQRDSRERRRADAVTNGHAVSRGVTDGHASHAPSRNVTLSQAKPSQPDQPDQEREGPASPPALALDLPSDHPAKPDSVADLWAYQERRRAELPGTRTLKLTTDRRKAIAARRKDGHTDDDLRACIDAYADEAKRTGNAEWFNGESNWVAANVARTLGRVGAARGRDGPAGTANHRPITGMAATAHVLANPELIPSDPFRTRP